MDKTFQQLVALVEKGTVEQRCAALVVAGGLKMTGAPVVNAAGALMHQPNAVLKDYALRYFEEAQPRNAAALLLPLLDDEDREVEERAVRLLGSFGQSAVEPLVGRAESAARRWQLNAARVLAAVRGKAALRALLQMLVEGTDEFNRSICDVLTPALREMDSGAQDEFYAELETFAARVDPKQNRAAAVSALRLMGQLGRSQARRWILKFIGPEWPPPIRSHALVALLQCLRGRELRKDELLKLTAVLEEAEFSEATRLALELLDAHDVPEEHRPGLSRLMQSPHADVQRFALRKLGEFGTPAAVRALVQQLGEPDYRRREVAGRSLRKIPESRGALVKELLACSDASLAWSIAEVLVAFDNKWRHETLEALWKRLQAAVEEDDRIQTAFLHVLKHADAVFAYRRLAEHGGRLLKAKKYKGAVAFLTLVKDFPEVEPQDKFVLALAQLKAHAHTVASQRQHPALEIMSDLYRHSTYPIFEALKKQKNVAPEELFALGFTLAERAGDERSLGRDLLQHLAAKFPRHKLGKNAKNKLSLP